MLTTFLLFTLTTATKALLALVLTYLIGGALLGKTWDLLVNERPREKPAKAQRVTLRDLLTPDFRKESWHGRLYRQAYGEDRKWLNDWIYRTPWRWMLWVEAVNHIPHEQPFVPDGPPASLCRTFHRIMLASWLYVPAVAERYFYTTRVGRSLLALFELIDRATLRQVRIGAMVTIGLYLFGFWGVTVGVREVNLYVRERELTNAAWEAQDAITKSRRSSVLDRVIAQELPDMVRNVRELAADFERTRIERCGSNVEDLVQRKARVEDFTSCAETLPFSMAISMFVWGTFPDEYDDPSDENYWLPDTRTSHARLQAERKRIYDGYFSWQYQENPSWLWTITMRDDVNAALRDALMDEQLADFQMSSQYHTQAELMVLASGMIEHMNQFDARQLGGSIEGLWVFLKNWRQLEELRPYPESLHTVLAGRGCWMDNGRWNDKWINGKMDGGQYYSRYQSDAGTSCAFLGSSFEEPYLIGRQLALETETMLHPSGLAQAGMYFGMLGHKGFVVAACVYALFLLVYLRLHRRKEKFLALSIIYLILKAQREMATDILHSDFVVEKVTVSILLAILSMFSLCVLLTAPLWAPPAVLAQQTWRSVYHWVTHSDTLRLTVSYLYTVIKQRACPFVNWT